MRTDYGLTEDKVKCAPGLDRALSNFAASLPMPQPTSNGLAKHDVTLVTDGPLQGWKDAVHFAFAETSGWTNTLMKASALNTKFAEMTRLTLRTASPMPVARGAAQGHPPRRLLLPLSRPPQGVLGRLPLRHHRRLRRGHAQS